MRETLETDLENPGTPEEEEIAKLGPWFHNLHLKEGLQTAPKHPLGDFPASKWREIEPYLPVDLHGWTVLDIGCNAGFHSFALAARGADVTAIDIDERYLEQARWAARYLDPKRRVRFRKAQVYELAGWDETFDLVWFMGVLYHLRYPMLALDIVTRKVGRLLVFQTLSMPGTDAYPVEKNLDLNRREEMRRDGWPKMAFIEHALAGDPTNWWAPNEAGIRAMLRSCGFEVAARPGHEIFLCERSRTNGGDRPGMADLLDVEYRSATGWSLRPPE